VVGVGIAEDVASDAELWSRATQHEFLAGVRDGTIAPAHFDTWVEQDYLFVANLLTFQAGLLAAAPRHAQPVLVDGCGSLVAELGWFEEMARARHLSLGGNPRPATFSYEQLLRQLSEEPFEFGLAALYVIERVYLEAWRFASPGAEPYRAFVAHWTEPGFGGYVDALAAAADRRPAAGQGEAIAAVLRAEAAFWDVAS
jgi:formylaminopyrimidine deformylase / aminopyrimidine aminohydrolase